MRLDSRPPPNWAPCLVSHRLSSPKGGGTLYAEEVTDLETHQQRLHALDGYRPSSCRCCGHGRLHIKDYRERKRHNQTLAPLTVVRYVCPRCKATFQVLPQFVAPHLWHSWPVVEAHALPPAEPEGAPPVSVPARTQRRWRARLLLPALLLVQVLATSGAFALEQLAAQVGLFATRAELVRAYQQTTRPPQSRCLSSLAALLHRLCPSVRLM